jgi:hypothetical protein
VEARSICPCILPYPCAFTMSNESRMALITFALVSLNAPSANTINSHNLPMISIAFVSF